MSDGKEHLSHKFLTEGSGKTPELDLSIVVPVFNFLETLSTLLERLTQVISPHTQSYEIILLDDGSLDTPWKVIQGFRETYDRHLVTVQLMRNYGQYNSLMCWLDLPRGNYVVIMDDDRRNPPEEIPKLFAHIEQHCSDLIYGYPNTRSHAAWSNVGSNIAWHFYRTVFCMPVPHTVSHRATPIGAKSDVL